MRNPEIYESERSTRRPRKHSSLPTVIRKFTKNREASGTGWNFRNVQRINGGGCRPIVEGNPGILLSKDCP